MMRTPASKSGMRASTIRFTLECADMKTSFKAPAVKRACAGAETTGRPGLTGSPNTVPTWAVYISEKVSGESHVTKDQRGGVSHLKTEVREYAYIHMYIHINLCTSPLGGTQ